MKNKIFEKIMRQAEQYKNFNDSLIRLFESILDETDDNNEETFTVNSAQSLLIIFSTFKQYLNSHNC